MNKQNDHAVSFGQDVSEVRYVSWLLREQAPDFRDDAWRRDLIWVDVACVVRIRLQVNCSRLQSCLDHENPTMGEKNNQEC